MWRSIRSFSSTATPLSIRMGGWAAWDGSDKEIFILKIFLFLLQSCSWSQLGVSSCRQSWSWERLSSVQPTDTNPWNIPKKRTQQLAILLARKLPTTVFSVQREAEVETLISLTVCLLKHNEKSSYYLTENAGTFSSAINSGSLYNELNLWHLRLSHLIFPFSETLSESWNV